MNVVTSSSNRAVWIGEGIRAAHTLMKDTRLVPPQLEAIEARQAEPEGDISIAPTSDDLARQGDLGLKLSEPDHALQQ